MRSKEITDYKKYISALRKCAKEHENDTTYTGHIIVSGLCRDTANLLEELGQESVLDKIRSDLEELYGQQVVRHCVLYGPNPTYITLSKVLQIIDKYKAENEDRGIKNADSN